jgi:hypothetical protein
MEGKGKGSCFWRSKFRRWENFTTWYSIDVGYMGKNDGKSEGGSKMRGREEKNLGYS